MLKADAHNRKSFAPAAFEGPTGYLLYVMRMLRSYWWLQLLLPLCMCLASLADGLSISSLFSFFMVIVQDGGPGAGYQGPNVFRWLISAAQGWPFVVLVYAAMGLMLVKVVFTYIFESLVAWAEYRITKKVRGLAFEKFMTVPVSWLLDHSSGELWYLPTDRPSLAPGETFRYLAELAGQGLTYLVYLFIMFTLSVKASLIFFAIFVPIALGARLLNRGLRKVATRSNRRMAAYSGKALEVLANLPLVRVFRNEQREQRQIAELVARHTKSRFLERLLILAQPNLPQLAIVLVLTGLTASYQGDLLTAMREILPLLLVFGLMINRFQATLANALNKLAAINANWPALVELVDFLEMRHETRWAEDGAPAPELTQGIELKDVTFAYPGSREKVLDGLSLSIPAGKRVALVGPSGAGKSTVLSLLVGFYDGYEGQIAVDGAELRSLDKHSWLGKLGLVTQEPVLFNLSARDNIRYGRPDATQEQIEAAARLAHAHGFLQETQDGYDTMLGERGARLSGGQKQRICIARAALLDPCLYLFDEATSNLDNQSQDEVMAAIKAIGQSKTMLIVAHRLSTVVQADLIYVLERGKVAESGSHAELLAAGGQYARMYHTEQKANATEELA